MHTYRLQSKEAGTLVLVSYKIPPTFGWYNYYMSTASERQKRVRDIARVRDSAWKQGVRLRSAGPGWLAMVGVDDGGAVWVWDEISRQLTRVAGPGTVDVNQLPPEPARRGPAPAPVVEKPWEWKERPAPVEVGFVGFSQP